MHIECIAQIEATVKYSKKFIESRNFFQNQSHTNVHIIIRSVKIYSIWHAGGSNVTITDLIHFDQILFYSGIQCASISSHSIRFFHSLSPFLSLALCMCVWQLRDFNTNKIDDYLVYEMHTENYPDKLLAKSIATNLVVWLIIKTFIKWRFYKSISVFIDCIKFSMERKNCCTTFKTRN